MSSIINKPFSNSRVIEKIANKNDAIHKLQKAKELIGSIRDDENTDKEKEICDLIDNLITIYINQLQVLEDILQPDMPYKHLYNLGK